MKLKVYDRRHVFGDDVYLATYHKGHGLVLASGVNEPTAELAYAAPNLREDARVFSVSS